MFSLELRQRGDSNEYTQYTISQYKKENYPKSSQICSYGICSKGLQKEFETAVVNEPSVFEPLKFYCIKIQLLIWLQCILFDSSRAIGLVSYVDDFSVCQSSKNYCLHKVVG